MSSRRPAQVDSSEALKKKPLAVEVMQKEDIPNLSVSLAGVLGLVEGNSARHHATEAWI